jgi:hypothetical protein
MEYPSAHAVSPAGPSPMDAFDAVGWSERQDGEAPPPVWSEPDEPTAIRMLSALPDWAVIGAGGVVAAILGAMVGGALHI